MGIACMLAGVQIPTRIFTGKVFSGVTLALKMKVTQQRQEMGENARLRQNQSRHSITENKKIEIKEVTAGFYLSLLYYYNGKLTMDNPAIFSNARAHGKRTIDHSYYVGIR